MNIETVPHPANVTGLVSALNLIETAQLIRPVGESDPTYLFKHALVQETAYEGLLKNDRKRLHRLVGDALERAYPDQLDEWAPLLGPHFNEAGDLPRAAKYLSRAGEIAVAQYANREALMFYTQALAAAEQARLPELPNLYRARGQIHEQLGNFESARADLERALSIAREQGDQRAAWQVLIALGFAWLARDYAQAGEYFQQALALARMLKDPTLLAHSLNRVGNWHLNVEEPLEALTFHREALSVFDSLQDKEGQAETHDLLGMTSAIGGDILGAAKNYERALALFTELNEPRGLASVWLSTHLRSITVQTDTLVLPPPSQELETLSTRALKVTREIGWRSGESYAHWALAFALAGVGEFGQALAEANAAFAIASEIDHRQWLTAARMTRGAIYLTILDPDKAQSELEHALDLARELGSLHWQRSVIGFLASTLIVKNELDRAQILLDEAVPIGSPARTLGQRGAYAARVELGLARRQPQQALAVLDQMYRDTPNLEPNVVIPRLWFLEARARWMLEERARAETLLHDAQNEAERQMMRPLLWQIHAQSAQLYRALGRGADAEQQTQAARRTIEELAQTIDDDSLRSNFIRRASRMILPSDA